MKEDKDILKRIGHSDGMTVPEGYFADFAARMADSLPTTPYESMLTTPVRPRTLWQRVRPYVYMAAMFAGVWCMLKMFTTLTPTPEGGFQPSPTLAEALGNDTFVSEYLLDAIDEYDLMDDLMDSGVNVQELIMELPDDGLNYDIVTQEL